MWSWEARQGLAMGSWLECGPGSGALFREHEVQGTSHETRQEERFTKTCKFFPKEPTPGHC